MRPAFAFVLVCVACTFAAANSRAAPLTEEEEAPGLAPRAALFHDREIDPGSEPSGPRSPLWFAVSGTLHTGQGAHEIGAMIVLSVPFDRLARSGRGVIGQAPALKPAPRAAKAQAEPDTAGGTLPADGKLAPSEPAVEPKLAIPVRITPEIARAAVRAALRQARLTAPEERLEALAGRARSSALLPELRVRATRLVDEAQNLSPTEYDPERTTASGGASLWLEARATWRLDRLVFADEEVAIERLRADRAEAQAKVVTRVLDLLFAWQRALALEAAPHLTPEDQLAASLKVLETAAALDVATDGWFTRWRTPRAAARAVGR